MFMIDSSFDREFPTGKDVERVSDVDLDGRNRVNTLKL